MIKRNSGNVSAVAIIIVILVILGGFYLFSGNKTSQYNTEVPNQNVSVTQTAGQPTVSTGAAGPITQSAVVLAGEVNPNGGQTSYWYEYGAANSLGSFSSPQLIGSGFGTFSAPGTLINLSANTTYYYRLAAENQYGKVYGPTLSFKTLAAGSSGTVSAPPVFTRPSTTTRDATVISSAAATLNGTVNPNGANTAYWFEYGTAFGLGANTASVPAGAGRVGVAASASITGLNPSTTYYYRLNAQNIYGTSIGSISVFTTQPANPTALPSGRAPSVLTSSATAVAKTSVTLNGEVNPQGMPTNYHFEYGRSTPFGLFNLERSTTNKPAGGGTALVKFSESLTALEPDSTYYYQIVAENQYGTSRGAIFSFTTTK